MPTVSRFVIWERPPDFRKTPPKLASVLGEVGIESLDRVHGREPSFLGRDRKSTRLNSSHDQISYAVFCLKKKKEETPECMIDQNVEVTSSRSISETS